MSIRPSLTLPTCGSSLSTVRQYANPVNWRSGDETSNYVVQVVGLSLLGLLLLSMAGCGGGELTTLSKEEFQKKVTEMRPDEVVKWLGKPTSVTEDDGHRATRLYQNACYDKPSGQGTAMPSLWSSTSRKRPESKAKARPSRRRNPPLTPRSSPASSRIDRLLNCKKPTRPRGRAGSGYPLFRSLEPGISSFESESS